MAERRQRRSTRRTLVTTGAVGGLVIAAGAVAAYAATSSAPPSYRIATVGKQTVDQTLVATGTVAPASAATVPFPVSGTVAEVLITAGDKVRAGQRLAALDTTDLQTAVASAKADLAGAKLTLQQAESGQQATAGGTGSSGSSGDTGSSGSSGGSDSSGGTGSSGGSGSSGGMGSRGSAGTSGSGGSARAAIVAAQQKVLRGQKQLDALLRRVKADLASATTLCPAGDRPSGLTGFTGLLTGTPAGRPTATPTGTPPATPTATPTGTPTPTPTGTPTGTPTPSDPGSPTGSPTSSPPTGEPPGGNSAACQVVLHRVLSEESSGLKLSEGLSRDIAALDKVLTAASATASAGADNGPSQSSQPSQPSGEGQSGGTGDSGTSAVVTAAQLAADQADVDAAEAELEVAEQALRQATIVSPIGGTVSTVGFRAGQQVSAGSSTAAVQVIGGASHVVTLTVDVAKIGQVKVGQAATVRPDGADATLAATVASVGVAPATTGGTAYPVTLALTGIPGGLRDGINAAVTLVTDKATGTLTVPTSAVHRLGQLAYVVVLSGGTTRNATITTGAVGAVYTEVTGGLKAGDQIVLADLNQAIPSGGTSNRFGPRGGLGGTGGGGLDTPGEPAAAIHRSPSGRRRGSSAVARRERGRPGRWPCRPGLGRATQDRVDRLVDIGLVCRPVGHRDPHRRPAVPGGVAEPAGGSLRLHPADDLSGELAGVAVANPDQHLVEHDLVDHLGPGRRAQPVGEAPRERAAAIHEVGQALPAERAERGADRDPAGPARPLRPVVPGRPGHRRPE